MVNYIVCGHGNFATGLESSVKLLAGEAPAVKYVDFTQDLSQDTLCDKFEEDYNSFTDASSVVILTDIVGGTPFKTAVTFSLSHENVYVISGTNLPLMLQVAISNLDDENIKDQLNEMISSSKEAMFMFDKDSF